MRTLIVSDLHLGAPGRLQTADGDLVHVLVAEPWDRVVLLGDVFDLWVKPLHEIIDEHVSVMAALDDLRCPVVFVPGNHDGCLRGIGSFNNIAVAWPSYRFRSGDLTIEVQHGDLHEESILGKARAGAWISCVVDSIASWIAGPGVSIRREVFRSFAGIQMRDRYAMPLMERAASESDADLVIAGHTHVPLAMTKVGDRYVANSGSYGIEQQTRIVIERETVELVRDGV